MKFANNFSICRVLNIYMVLNICRVQGTRILKHLSLSVFVFLALIFQAQISNAQDNLPTYNWCANELSTDGRLKEADLRVVNVAQIAFELSRLRNSNYGVSYIDFFAAIFLKESILGRNADNNVAEAIINKLGEDKARAFKHAIITQFNNGGSLLSLDEDGNITISNIESVRTNHTDGSGNLKADFFKPTMVQVNSSMKKLFEKANESKNKENDRYRNGHDEFSEENSSLSLYSSFTNTYVGLEHFLLGLMRMENNDLARVLVEEALSHQNLPRKWPSNSEYKVLDAAEWMKADAVKIAFIKMYGLIEDVRDEPFKTQGISSRTSYEEYALGNAPATGFGIDDVATDTDESEEGTAESDPTLPDFLTDMVETMKDSTDELANVRVKRVKQLATKLKQNTSVVELYSEFDGVGKKVLVRDLAKMLDDIQAKDSDNNNTLPDDIQAKDSDNNNTLPDEIHNIKLYEVDVNKFLAGDDQINTQYVGSISRRVGQMTKFAETMRDLGHQPVFVFNDMSAVFNLGVAGSSDRDNTSLGLGDALTQYMSNIQERQASPKTLKIIAITNDTTTHEVNTNWEQFTTKMRLETPNKEELKSITKPYIDTIAQINDLKSEFLHGVFDRVYQVTSMNPNLGNGIRAIEKMYSKIAEILDKVQKYIGATITTSGSNIKKCETVETKIVLQAMAELLRSPQVTAFGCTDWLPEQKERFLGLQQHLNNTITGRDQIIDAVFALLKNGMNQTVTVENGTIKPRARATIVLVGPSGIQKTTLVEQIQKQLGIPMDTIVANAINLEALQEIADKVRSHQPTRMVYLNEVNRTKGQNNILDNTQQEVFNTIENMLDGTGITDEAGRKTTFENVFFFLDANVNNADNVAKKWGFSEDVPDDMIDKLDDITDDQAQKDKIDEIKETGIFIDYNKEELDEIITAELEEDNSQDISKDQIYNKLKGIRETCDFENSQPGGTCDLGDLEGEVVYVFSDFDKEHTLEHPRGLIKFTETGKKEYLKEVKQSFVFQESFERRSGGDDSFIAIGWLTFEAYKGIVKYEVKLRNNKIFGVGLENSENDEGSKGIEITNKAVECIAKDAMSRGISTGSGYVNARISRLLKDIDTSNNVSAGSTLNIKNAIDFLGGPAQSTYVEATIDAENDCTITVNNVKEGQAKLETEAGEETEEGIEMGEML